MRKIRFRSSFKGKFSVRKKIPEPSLARKKPVDIGILIKSRNCDRKIMQTIRIRRGLTARLRKWNQFEQFR